MEKPVDFGNPENDPVSIVIAFSTIDNKSHIGIILQKLTELLLIDESIVKDIKSVRNDYELLNIIM